MHNPNHVLGGNQRKAEQHQEIERETGHQLNKISMMKRILI